MTQTLLVADDSVTVQRVIELTFADEGIRVVTVGDGSSAIERIEREPPDIVLADIGMPERDGYEVAAFVKTRPALAHIPVILLAGAFDSVDRSRAADVGCDDVLIKPFEPHLVVARVKELLGGRSDLRGADATASTPIQGPGPRAESADELFARLDEAFATLGMSTEPAPSAHPPTPPPSMAQPVSGDSESLAAAFRSLLASERGESTEPASSPAPMPRPTLMESDVERVVLRVLERLNDGLLRDATRDLVAPIAERLVREEIARIKSSQGT
jgi:CheY-like chemotaxis protein